MTNLETKQIDPNKEHLGKIYAKALIDAAEKSGDTEVVVTQLESLLTDVLANLTSLASYLQSPRVALEAKTQLLDRALAAQISPVLLNFLKVVARRGRMDSLAEMAVAARHLFNEARQMVEVEVRAAVELDETMRSQLSDVLTSSLGRKVQLRVQVDSTLIGGIVLRIGDQVIDGSVVTRLTQMRQQIRDRTFQQIRAAIDRFADNA